MEVAGRIAGTFAERMRALDPKSIESRPVSARALKRVVDLGRTRGDAPLRFGVTFPFSSHNYELRYWVASAGIDPDRELDIVVAPPCAMVRTVPVGSTRPRSRSAQCDASALTLTSSAGSCPFAAAIASAVSSP